MSTPGLSHVSAQLADLVTAAGDTARRRAVRAGCDLAVQRSGLTDPRAQAARQALAGGATGEHPARAGVHALAEELDQAAWDLQDRAETGQASQDEYARAFNQARAASALDFAFDPDSLTAATESLYEAHHAIEDLPALTRAVEQTVTG